MSEAIDEARCIGVKFSFSRNRYTKGWYQSAPPRRCKNPALPGARTCRYHSEDGATIYNSEVQA